MTDGEGAIISTHAATISTQTDKERPHPVMMFHDPHFMLCRLLAEFLSAFMLVLVAAGVHAMETKYPSAVILRSAASVIM